MRQNPHEQRRLSLLISLGFLLMLMLTACEGITGQSRVALQVVREPVEDGNIEQGRQLLIDYGCGACHTIPGIPGANAHVGPPLTDWAKRHYIAGNLPNTLENLTSWIINPQGVEPGTAMPILGVDQEEALHMSAYLYTLGN